MWILFGTNHDIMEHEPYVYFQKPYVYFIGIFDNIETAKAKRQLCISLDYSEPDNDYFIKEVRLNQIYDLEWSNDRD
jgi:hypothetical protein